MWSVANGPASCLGLSFSSAKFERARCPTVQRDTAPDSSTCILPMWMRRSATVALPGRSWRAPCHPTRYSISTGRKKALEGFEIGFSQRGSMIHTMSKVPLRLPQTSRRVTVPRSHIGPHLLRQFHVLPALALAAVRWAHRIGTTVVGTSILTPQPPHQLA